MGRKNKNISIASEENVSSNTLKKRKISNDDSERLSSNVKEDNSQLKIKKTKKENIKKVLKNNEHKDNTETVNDVTVEAKTKKVKKNKTKTNQAPNKKIKFNDDGLEENDSNNGTASNLNFLQGEEAEVKEEDIDKFVEEITEEDNEQYENWVKLVEAQLSSSKNKKKTNKT